jgi:hypothetical protein
VIRCRSSTVATIRLEPMPNAGSGAARAEIRCRGGRRSVQQVSRHHRERDRRPIDAYPAIRVTPLREGRHDEQSRQCVDGPRCASRDLVSDWDMGDDRGLRRAAFFARSQLREARALRLQQHRPYVIADIVGRSTLIFLYFKEHWSHAGAQRPHHVRRATGALPRRRLAQVAGLTSVHVRHTVHGPTGPDPLLLRQLPITS